jgi:hypothetical protein
MTDRKMQEKMENVIDITGRRLKVVIHSAHGDMRCESGFFKCENEKLHSDTEDEDTAIAVEVFSGLKDGKDDGHGVLRWKCREST